jgi:hypothetical protein
MELGHMEYPHVKPGLEDYMCITTKFNANVYDMGYMEVYVIDRGLGLGPNPLVPNYTIFQT